MPKNAINFLMSIDATPLEESGQPELHAVTRRQLSPEEKAKRAERARLARAAKTKVVEGVAVKEPPRVFMSHGVKIPQIIPVRRRPVSFNIKA